MAISLPTCYSRLGLAVVGHHKIEGQGDVVYTLMVMLLGMLVCIGIVMDKNLVHKTINEVSLGLGLLI